MAEVVVDEVEQLGWCRLRLDVDGDPKIDAVAVDHADLEMWRVRRALSAPFDGAAPQNTVALQRHDPLPLVDAGRCERANAERDPSMTRASELTYASGLGSPGSGSRCARRDLDSILALTGCPKSPHRRLGASDSVNGGER
jgi:hypothetical protein